jgi:hypothetical protein
MEQINKPEPPPNYLALSIITTLFCCQIFGIISIIYAAQVNSKYMSGDYAGAESASKNAKNWSLAAIALGVLAILITLLFFGGGLFAAISSGEFDL